MKIPHFEDVYPGYNGAFYQYTNEDVTVAARAIGDVRFGKVGGIAAAGEMSLGVMLARAYEGVFVDHCYGSLAVCFMKALMLGQLGPKGFMNALSTDGAFNQAQHNAHPHLPEVLRKYFTPFSSVSYGTLRDCRASIYERWAKIPMDALERVYNAIDHLTLLHGDISDLGKYGPFSGIYFSNIFDSNHKSRFGATPKIDDMATLMGEDPVVFATGSFTSGDGWMDNDMGPYGSAGLRHHLLRKAALPRSALRATFPTSAYASTVYGRAYGY